MEIPRSLKTQATLANLDMPPEFWLLDEVELGQLKCGAGSGIKERLVPETMWMLRVTVCCTAHDLDWDAALVSYMKSGDEERFRQDIKRANERFLTNLIRFVNTFSHDWLKGVRRYRATTYYNAVEDIGKRCFIREGINGRGMDK